jgi:DNA repair/transcription protein MET18/MMS19
VEAELLPPLLRVLLQLAVYRPAAAVRETALQCLLLLVDLPYTSLHPHRRSVARVLACAVDDSRRAVRLRAARCRLAWSAF